jgi:hypothetical protein
MNLGARAIATLPLALVAVLVAFPAHAHSTGESFLVLRPATAGASSGTWDLAVRDLDDALTIDADGDGRITAAELRARQGEIAAYALTHLALARSGEACAPSVDSFAIGQRAGVAQASLGLRLGCPEPASSHDDRLVVRDDLFFDRDGLHRAFVTVERQGQAETSLFRAGRTEHSFALGVRGPGAASAAAGFVREGVLHIWQGLDHVLFVIVLLLPAVLRRIGADSSGAHAWVPVPTLRAALGDVVPVITAFTVAHSITLALAALGALRASARIIEPAIAASVVLAALNNLRPTFGRDRWVVAFALGLLHGFGFSAVLAEVGLPKAHLVAALFGFNLGVEIGQLALVALVVPLAFVARKSVLYRRLGLLGGSAVAGAVAVVWMIERIVK